MLRPDPFIFKINYKVAFEPIKEKEYPGGVKRLEEKPNEFVSYEDYINQQTEDKSPEVYTPN